MSSPLAPDAVALRQAVMYACMYIACTCVSGLLLWLGNLASHMWFNLVLTRNISYCSLIGYACWPVKTLGRALPGNKGFVV